MLLPLHALSNLNTSMLYVLFGLCGLCVIWLWLRRDDMEPSTLSGKLPIIGHGFSLLGDSVAIYNVIKTFSEESLQKGGIAKLYVGPVKFYFVSDPKDSLSVSTHCVKKHYIYNFGRPLLGNGLLSADVATWKTHRKLLNPAFSQQVLCGFLDVFNSQAQRLVELFASHIGKEFDHEKYFRINNLETVCTTVTGADAGEYDNLQKRYLPHFDNVLHIFNERFNKFWWHSDIIYNWSSLKKRETEEMQHVNELSETIIQKKKTEFKESRKHGDKQGKLNPFLDLLLALAEDVSSFTDEQIRCEINTIIAGGHDTTASAITFAITLLGSNPQAQEKAYKEILEVIGESERDVDKEDLTKLVYIEAIIKESLRLYPSVPIIARQLDTDIKLRNCTLKANTACLLSIYGVNRHKMWGPDANEFRPERWLDKETLPDAKYHAAFGMGRRSCIGKGYAMMGMKVMLVHVIKKYRISSDISKMVVRMDVFIRPVSGHQINIQQRNI